MKRLCLKRTYIWFGLVLWLGAALFAGCTSHGTTIVGNTQLPTQVTLDKIQNVQSTIYIPIPVLGFTESDLSSMTLDVLINGIVFQAGLNPASLFRSDLSGVLIPVSPISDGDRLLLKVYVFGGELDYTGVFSADHSTTATQVSFGTEVVAQATFTEGLAAPTSMRLVDADHLRIGGQISQGVVAAQFTTSGVLDPSFHGSGTSLIDLATLSSRTFQMQTSAIDSLGRIVEAGITRDSGQPSDFVLTRFTVAGDLDTSFGDNGLVITHLSDSGSQALYALAIDDSDRILIAGTAYTTKSFPAILRYKSDGSLDSAFGVNGVLDASRYTDSDSIQALGFRPQTTNDLEHGFEKAILAATASIDRVSIRLIELPPEPYGSTLPIDSFLLATATTPVEWVNRIAVDTQGRAIVLGLTGASLTTTENGNAGYTLVRFPITLNPTPAGIVIINLGTSADPAFGTSGIVRNNSGNSGTIPNNVVIDSQDRILVAGYAANATADALLARHSTNGDLDTTFNGNGMVTLDTGCGDEFKVIVTDTNDGLFATGPLNNILSVVHYTASGVQDTGFGMSVESVSCNL